MASLNGVKFYLPLNNYSGMPNWSNEVTISIYSDVLIISSSSLVALTPKVEALAPLRVEEVFCSSWSSYVAA